MINLTRFVRNHFRNFERRLRNEEISDSNQEENSLQNIQAIEPSTISSSINFIELIVNNCLRFSSVSKLFESQCIKDEMENSEKLLMLKIHTTDLFDKLTPKEVEQLNNKCKNKSILIFIDSKNDENFAIYWKLNPAQKLLTFVPYNKPVLQQKRKVYEFVYDFLAESMKNGHLGIPNSSADGLKIELHHFVDSRNFGLLMTAVEWRRNDVVQDFLNHELDTEAFCHETRRKINAVDVAWQNGKDSSVLLTFLNANSIYPKLFELNEVSNDVKEFLTKAEELHEAIRSKNVTKIKEILAQNPNQRHFYNSSNMSAAKLALTLKFIKIYELLVEHTVHLGQHESLFDLLSIFSESECELLKEIHFKYSVQMPERHLHCLTINSSVAHDDRSASERHHFIRYAFDYLNAIPMVRIILLITAASKIFNIVFDFSRDTVSFMVPREKSVSKGLFYTVGRIYVAAFDLLRSSTERETFGTLAHELCHYAMNLVYKNDSKPYFKKDTASKDEFERISKICQQNCHKEKLIEWVFEYSPHQQHAELIVRVPHLMAKYNKDKNKLRQIREYFIELFTYYETKVFPDMKQALPKIEAENQIENKNFKILEYKFWLIVLIVLFTIGSIAGFFIIRSIYYQKVYEYNELTPDEQNTFKNSPVNYKNIEGKLRDLLHENSEAYAMLNPYISKSMENQILDFDNPQLAYMDKFIVFQWEDLAEKFKFKLLNSIVNFQGQTVVFYVLNMTYPNAFNSLTSQQIKDILNGTEILIDDDTKSDIDFYADRNFLPEQVKLVYFEYAYGHDYVDDVDKRNSHISSRTLNKTFAKFYEEFLQKNFDERSNFYSSVKQNHFYASRKFYLNSVNFHLLYKNLTEIIKLAKDEKIFILSSGAGAGKTVTFERIANAAKLMYPTDWVSYIDLKKYTILFKLNGIVENVQELLEKILNLSSKSEFERKIFEAAFKSGKVILLWNGFDEISPTFNEFILSVIKFIHENTKNVQFVCTRPLYSDQLSKTFKIQTWQLVPFNGQTVREFLKKFFIFRNISSGKIFEEIQKVEKIIGKFQFNKKAYYNFNTPLMLKMAAEAYENNKTSKFVNIYDIFDNFVDTKIEIWSNKSINSKTAASKMYKDAATLKLIFQKYAFLNSFNLFSTHTLSLKIRKLLVMNTELPQSLNNQEITSMGILYINSKNEFEFAHKTFSEFFVAQYFIENIYNAVDYVNDNEIELRLEIFFKVVQGYGINQKIIVDFISSYLQIQNKNNNSNFGPKIPKLLKTKFRKFLIRMLSTNNPEVFDFLFKFFQKDYEIFADLLHVNDMETFYTAIFNPNYFSLFLKPKIIENSVRNRLSDEQLKKFLTGKNQKGKIIFGTEFSNLMCQHRSAYDPKAGRYTQTAIKCSKNSFWDFFDKTHENLTIDEKKELFLTVISPKIYLFYDITFNSSNILEYEKVWTKFENLLTKIELRNALGSSLIDYFEISRSENNLSEQFLSFLLEKAQKLFESNEILKIFQEFNIFHEAQTDEKRLKILWNFLKNHTKIEQRRKILLQDDNDDRNIYPFTRLNDLKDKYSDHKFSYFYYDFTPFKIVHRSLLTSTAITFDYTIQIYQEHFNKNEMQNIIMSSNEFMYYVVRKLEEEKFIKFTLYLKELFKGSENILKEFLDRKIEPTSLTVFQFIEEFRGLPLAQTIWFKNLEKLTDLYETL